MIIEVSNLTKKFTQGSRTVEALSEISFSLEPKTSLAIVGPSGSGKTTLLSLLAGLDQFNTGEIKMNGTSLGPLDENQLGQFRAKNIGIVFQQFHLMPHLTALENVSLPLDIAGETNVEKRAQEVLQKVGLGERMDHRPHELSGGECQRVAIARAFVSEPKILLADEPSGNLDTATGEKVMDLLFDLAKTNEMTMVLITHDLDLAQRCDRQIHLVGGKIQ